MPLVYTDEFVTLYHGDCRDELAWLSADVMITDPPYGMNYQSGWTDRSAIQGDDGISLRNEVLGLWKDKPALVFGTWRVPRPLSKIRELIIWDKQDFPGMGDLSLPWGPAHEEIYVIGQGWTGKRRANVYRVSGLPPTAAYRPDHPTPKPVSLMEQLVEYAPAGVIADPFAGSGATLVAARNQGRQAIGVEVDERYCQVIIDRLSQGVLV